MYDCILELFLPNYECKQYELWDKFTNTKLKNMIFSTTESLRELNQSDYELMITKEEKLSVDFYKYVVTEEIKERIEKGLPVKLYLIKRSSKMAKKSSAPDMNFQEAIEEKPKSELKNGPPLPDLSFKNSLSFLIAESDEKQERARSGTFNSSPPVPILSPPNTGRKRAGTSSINSASPLSILSPRISTSPPTPSTGLTNSSPSLSSSPSSSSGRFKSLFKSHSSSSKIAIYSKSMSEIKRSSQSNINNNNNNFNNFEDTVMEIPAPPEDSELIEQNQFGYHFELGLKSMDSLAVSDFFLEIPRQENLYTKYFINKDHKNYVGEIEGIGPAFISLIEEKDKKCTRGLVRIPQRTYHICTDQPGQLKGLKLILSRLHISLPYKSFKRTKSQELISELEKFDQSHIVKNYKFGVLYCREGQTTEDEWFSNEHGSPYLFEFMDLLGTRIPLLGWNKFRGGLDTKTNTTGTESYYTEFAGNEVMFHVSTLLPYSELDEQKIERKRHLGNDIVVIVFKEGNTKFIPSTCKSVFNHFYIVVSKEPNNMYRVEIAIKDGVKPFGPSFPSPSLIPKDLIKDFILTKMLNAEWAAYRSLEFSHKFKRTRQQQLKAILNSLTSK